MTPVRILVLNGVDIEISGNEHINKLSMTFIYHAVQPHSENHSYDYRDTKSAISHNKLYII